MDRAEKIKIYTRCIIQRNFYKIRMTDSTISEEQRKIATRYYPIFAKLAKSMYKDINESEEE